MDKIREILEKYFGKDYLRDIHTGNSIDMSSEIDDALTDIKSLLLSEKEVREIISEFVCTPARKALAKAIIKKREEMMG